MREGVMLLFVVQHTLIVYTFLVLALGALGRQQMGQWTLVDYVVVALLGSAVETGLYLGSGSFWAGILSAVTLLLANRALRLFADRAPFVHRFIVGTPILVVHDGEVLDTNLRRARLTEQDLLTALRTRGYDSVAAVRFAVVEANGLVGVVPKDGEQSDSSGSA